MSRPNRTIISMPPELLGLIITYVSFDEPCAPLRLARVSHSFHGVAMSTPGAWRKLILRVPSTSTEQMMDFEHPQWLAIRKAKMWFERSGVCSVDISVEVDQPSLAPLSASDHTTRVVGLHRGCEAEEDALAWEEWGASLLPHILSRFQHRIKSLHLHTTTPEEAQAFFGAVYPPPSLDVGSYDLPLEVLAVVAVNDAASHTRAGTLLAHTPTPKVRQSSSSISDTLCKNNFPHLEHLKFVNLPLPLTPSPSWPSDDPGLNPLGPSPAPTLPRLLSADTGHRLRSLSVTYPVRFAPIPLLGLLDALRATPGLERLEIEGRITSDGISQYQQAQGVVPPQGQADTASARASPSDQPLSSTSSVFIHAPASASTASPFVSSTSTTSSISPHNPSATSSHAQSRPLLALASLEFLALKVNKLPALLSSLVLPTLRELRIEDMDAKRRGAAHETAEALRGVIVRGDMPLDRMYHAGEASSNVERFETAKAQARGRLEVLDMRGIALRHPRGISAVPAGGVSVSHSTPHVPTHSTHPNTQEDDAAAATWRWCFRRLNFLQRLRVERMDLDALLGYITPSLPSGRSLQVLQPRGCTSDDRSCLIQGEPHRSAGSVEQGTTTISSEDSTLGREKDPTPQTEVDVELLRYLKRLTIADYVPVSTWVGDSPGIEPSASPFVVDAWSTVDHAFTSASIRVFKARRPDVVVENAPTRSSSARSSGIFRPVSSHVPYALGSPTRPIDYLSLYLQ